MDIERGIKRLLLLFLAVLIVFFFANLEYFSKQIVFFLSSLEPGDKDRLESYVNPPKVLAPNTLYVDSLEITAPVQYVSEENEDVFQKALEMGVVHYPGTALPGQTGNVYIFGHSSDNAWSKGQYKTIFALLPQIEIGAVIRVTNQFGIVYTYQVREKRIVSPRAVEYLEQDETKKVLTLQTSYPIGTSLKRYIVIAELVE